MNIYIESAPDWRAWGELRTIRLFDAVVLSLGVCPDWLNYTNQTNPAHSIFTEIASELKRRGQVSSNRAREFSGWPALYPEQQRLEAKISIADYVNWVTSIMNWKVPQEFAALARVDTTASVGAMSAVVNLANTTHRVKSRINDLDGIISEARKEVADPNNANDVFIQLRVFALDGRAPFEDVKKEGLEYTNTENEKAILTKEGLRKRIARNKWPLTDTNGH